MDHKKEPGFIAGKIIGLLIRATEEGKIDPRYDSGRIAGTPHYHAGSNGDAYTAGMKHALKLFKATYSEIKEKYPDIDDPEN